MKQRRRNKQRYERGVSILNELLAANLAIYRTGQKLTWCIDDRMGHCMSITFNMADGTHEITEDYQNA